MRKRIKRGIVAAVFASLLISGLATRLSAQDRCANASLHGSYAFKVDGTNVSNPYLPLGPFAAVGRNTYDGNVHQLEPDHGLAAPTSRDFAVPPEPKAGADYLISRPWNTCSIRMAPPSYRY